MDWQELTGTFYEWLVELCDEFGDIHNHLHEIKLKDLKTEPEIDAEGFWPRLVLVRDVFRDGDMKDRSWAYITKDGELPTHTDGGDKVPKKYHKEFEQNKEWASKLGNHRIDWQANLDKHYETKRR
jgi:hypothetical protein